MFEFNRVNSLKIVLIYSNVRKKKYRLSSIFIPFVSFDNLDISPGFLELKFTLRYDWAFGLGE